MNKSFYLTGLLLISGAINAENLEPKDKPAITRACCANLCVPCVNPCLVAGAFTTTTGDPINQIGSQFQVTRISPAANFYAVTFCKPFCRKVTVVTLDTSTAPSNVRIQGQVGSGGFVINVPTPGTTVTFMAMPCT